MKKTWRFFFTALWIVLAAARPVFAEYEHSYHYYMSLGIKAYDKGYYEKAIDYFESAHALDPSRATPVKFINLIRRYKDVPLAPAVTPVTPRVVEPQPIKPVPVLAETVVKAKAPDPVPTRPASRDKNVAVIVLDDTLWSRQPNIELGIDMRKTYILRGRNIERFLAVKEDFLEITRVDKDQISILTRQRGSTFLYVWDQRGRWSLNVRGLLPIQQSNIPGMEYEQSGEEPAPSFKFAYSNDWSALYVGDKIPDMQRRSLTFSQWVGTYGKTPYGDFDASVNFYKFPETTELIGQRFGLINGHIGPFRDFSIRVYDTDVFLSDLSLPGRSFRGGKIDAYAFNRDVQYVLFQGQDRAQYLYLTPESFDVSKSYIEGASMTVFPDGDHSASFNYARGYGDARESYLKDRVYSIESRNQFNNFMVYGEAGYDGDVASEIVRTELLGDNFRLNVNARDIDKDYQAITGYPAGRGEAGGNIRYDYHNDQARVNSNLDVYRDRYLFNPDESGSANLRWNGFANYRLTQSSDWSLAAYASYAPQQLSPSSNYTVSNTYSKRLPWMRLQSLSVSLGHAIQFSRYPNSEQSDFDRQSLLAAVRFPLIRNMSYYANYEFSWVNDVFHDELSTPNAFSTGIDYSWSILDPLTCTLNFRYRNEENTGGTFSFLSGEDYIRGGIGLSYRPTRDTEIYFDGNIRNVWSENPNNAAFNDADIRLGVRSSWDTFFRWNPTGLFEGTVFNDINGNNIQDPEEPGLDGIRVKVGKKTAMTDRFGRYYATVKAQRVRVILDVNSIPKGYLTVNGFSKDFNVEQNKTYVYDFALTSHAGVYGVVFVDKNGNGVQDRDDPPVPKVMIFLDDALAAASNYDGMYSYNNIQPGRHTISIDLKSLPVQYLPLVKLKTDITVGEGVTFVFHVPLKEKE